VLITSSIKGNGYGSFLVVALSFLMSTQILNFPFFPGTTIIGDSQVASSIGLIKFATSNLLIFCLTIVV
jgi:hypothetical protein